jgi:hypothetical protein
MTYFAMVSGSSDISEYQHGSRGLKTVGVDEEAGKAASVPNYLSVRPPAGTRHKQPSIMNIRGKSLI